jgi:glutathione S-transferase
MSELNVFDLTLYWLIPRDRSSRIRWLLRELNVEFSEKKLNASVGEHRQGDFLNVNPVGKVPAIVADNLALSESGAILLYLLEKFDSKNRFSPARDSLHWPGFLQWFFWGLTTFESATFAFNETLGEKESANIERFIGPLEQTLSSNDYLVGDSFTVADIVCAYDLGILSGKYDLNTNPAVHAYLTRLLARPAATSFARAIAWP